jgi:CBS-domain-containing membrane protein
MDVSEIMTLEVTAVRKDTPLKDAAALLAKFRIHAMPVVDEKNKVVGIISESDFFTKDSSNIYLPTFLDFIKDESGAAKAKAESAEIEKTINVADIMSEGCTTVKPNLPVKQLIKLFKETSFKTMPVAEEDGTLVGVVAIMDVIKLL